MWSEMTSLFREYMGTGLIVIWYLLAVVYLLLKEKRREIRIIFVYVPVVLLLLYFNPLFAVPIHNLIGSEIYYRILWLLPMTIVISYVCACIYGELKGRKREIMAVCMAGILMVSGSFIYSNPYFHEAENLYHVPDSVVEICDAINVPGREVRAAFPVELLQYVRQYSPTTHMPYGREVLMGAYNTFYPAMESEIIDLETVAPMARSSLCHYLVFRQGQKFSGEPADYGWMIFFETDDYVVYRDTGVELVIPLGHEGK